MEGEKIPDKWKEYGWQITYGYGYGLAYDESGFFFSNFIYFGLVIVYLIVTALLTGIVE